MKVVQIKRSVGGGPDDVTVFTTDGEYLGDVERMRDGTWDADITMGVFAPKHGFETRDEAIAYVVDPSGSTP